MQKLALTFKSLLFAVALCGLLLAGCSGEEPRTNSLFNIDSLIRNQIHFLLDGKAEIRKKAVLNGVEKITTIHPKDSLTWNDELAIFSELDIINKPIHRAAYKVEDLADKESNLRIRAFTATEDLPVRFLKVYYFKTLDQIRKIEAQYHEKNSLYKSTRLLTMEFENISGKAMLTAYAVDGGQKMFLDDSVQYTIDAGIAKKK